MADLVSIGVPVYRGRPFIGEALDSILAQAHRDLDVLISVDGNDAESADACRPYLRDSRFRMVVQERQLGWADNISHLMAECRGAFWYYHQQDDIVAPDYVSQLIAVAQARPAVAVVYSDILTFGNFEQTIVQRSVVGSPARRELDLLVDHHPAVAFRGLTRREALAKARGVRGNEVDNFSADTTWMASVARAGALIRLPKTLYRKRFHAGNVHTKWAEWPLEKRRLAWCVHCRDMFLEAAAADVTLLDRRLMWHAALARLVARVARGYLPVAEFGPREKDAVLEQFVACLAGHTAQLESVLLMSFSEIAAGARRFYRVG